ncbi:MAG: class I SAM-dependent methyltransferase [Gammaproteobacteria bacterium]|nr:class I SAM-dependent methyltransferase [Gammaproteobacteria bacterium]MYJ75264.1 class I SAM-dependent methyltransferase [Gammaproteobacteria bacterium]
MTSFKSTAAFYSRYRVPYPERLLARLKAETCLGHDSVVLDLATGPGRLALALAPSVRQVVAVDIEPEMLDEGRRLARGADIPNVRWVQARAEDLAVAPGSADLEPDRASGFPQEVSCGYTIAWKRGSDATGAPTPGGGS